MSLFSSITPIIQKGVNWQIGRPPPRQIGHSPHTRTFIPRLGSLHALIRDERWLARDQGVSSQGDCELSEQQTDAEIQRSFSRSWRRGGGRALEKHLRSTWWCSAKKPPLARPCPLVVKHRETLQPGLVGEVQQQKKLLSKWFESRLELANFQMPRTSNSTLSGELGTNKPVKASIWLLS